MYLSTNINVRTPSITGGGLVHLGMAMCIFSSIVFGKKIGAIAGGVGFALFDILSDYVLWAPFTFVISLVIGYLVGLIANHNGKTRIEYCIIAIIVATFIKVAGYYLAEIFMYHNLLSPIASIPGNVIQMVIGAVVGVPFALMFKNQKIARYINLK